MMLVIFFIYAMSLLYLTIRLVAWADGFFVKRYQDNSYAVFSSRIMLAGVSMLLLGTALDIFLKMIS